MEQEVVYTLRDLIAEVAYMGRQLKVANQLKAIELRLQTAHVFHSAEQGRLDFLRDIEGVMKEP